MEALKNVAPATVLSGVPNLKETNPFLSQYDDLKNITTDDELDSQLNDETSDSDDDDDDGNCEFNNAKSNKSRRNRRKPLQPQKTVSGSRKTTSFSSAGNCSSECSQDACTENVMLNLIASTADDHFLELADGDDLLRDIDEENIFKGLQEEIGAEKLDDEIIDNVKEEWKNHWGIKCNMCEQLFPYKATFDKHYLNSYSQSPVYTCTFCNKTCDKYSTFRSHCYRHITEGRYKCTDCTKAFSLQSMLHVHILAKHTKAKPFTCEECGKSFVTKPGLKIHMKKHKTEIKEEYACVECGKVLHTRGGLTSHMNVHRLGRRFMCDICGKTFTQKVNMQQHVKQHTGDKPHVCEKCGKTFAERSHLARHVSFHSETRPYKCGVCQKMYKTERCLKVHSLVHAAERPFVCTYCGKGFLSSTKLKQHFNIHTGERPFKCKYCERTFTNYPNWLKHIRRRHKVDHKTGQMLETKTTTTTTTMVAPSAATTPPTIETVITTDSVLLNDLTTTLNKSDEFLLQQNLLNLPTTTTTTGEEKFLLQQQFDFLNGSTTNSMGLLVPYLQGHHTFTTSNINNSQTSSSISLQLSDFLPVHCLHSLSCD